MKTEKEQEIKAEEEIRGQAQVEEIIEKDVAPEEQKEASSEDATEAELTEVKDKYLRLYSEFENFRRRTAKEKLDLISTANQDLMTALLPVVDDFERAMSASGNEDEKSLKEGISLVQNKFTRSLESKGLKKMEVTKGDGFDDDKHEAITQIPTEKDFEGKIVDVVESGYYLGEKVIRFAKVVVGEKQ